MKYWKIKGFITNLYKTTFYGLVPHLEIRATIRAIRDLNHPFTSAPLIGVEIGVERGLNALNMLKTLNVKKLYLIDPYLEHVQGDLDYTHKLIPQYKNDVYYQCAVDILSGYKDNIEWIHKNSDKAVSDIPNDLDFVYIDGNHAYEVVKNDIRLYYPKLKKGGIIGGDDFWANYPGVARAVFEFIDENDLKFNGDGREWWIVK